MATFLTMLHFTEQGSNEETLTADAHRPCLRRRRNAEDSRPAAQV